MGTILPIDLKQYGANDTSLVQFENRLDVNVYVQNDFFNTEQAI